MAFLVGMDEGPGHGAQARAGTLGGHCDGFMKEYQGRKACTKLQEGPICTRLEQIQG